MPSFKGETTRNRGDEREGFILDTYKRLVSRDDAVGPDRQFLVDAMQVTPAFAPTCVSARRCVMEGPQGAQSVSGEDVDLPKTDVAYDVSMVRFRGLGSGVQSANGRRP